MTRKSAVSASQALLDDLKAQNLKPALAIIGEPTLMKIVGAHKGGAKLVHPLLRPGTSFQRPGKRRQCRDDGGRIRDAAGQCVGRVARRCRSALRPAPFHRAGHRDPWRHGGEHPGARSRSDLGVSLPARPRSRQDRGRGSRAAPRPKSCRNTSAAPPEAAFAHRYCTPSIPAWRWTRIRPPSGWRAN